MVFKILGSVAVAVRDIVRSISPRIKSNFSHWFFTNFDVEKKNLLDATCHSISITSTVIENCRSVNLKFNYANRKKIKIEAKIRKW